MSNSCSYVTCFFSADVRVCACLSMCVCACVRLCVHVRMCVFVCLCACMRECVSCGVKNVKQDHMVF